MGDNNNGPTKFEDTMDDIRQLWLAYKHQTFDQVKAAALAAGPAAIDAGTMNWLQTKTTAFHAFRFMGFMTPLSPTLNDAVRDTRCWEFFALVTDIHIPMQCQLFINKKADIQNFIGNGPLVLPKKFFQQVTKVSVFNNKNHLLYLFSIIWKIRVRRMDPANQTVGNQYYYILEKDWIRLIKGVGLVCELWDRLSQELCDDDLLFHDWAFSEELLFFGIDDLQFKKVTIGHLPEADAEYTINTDNPMTNNLNATPLTPAERNHGRIVKLYEDSVELMAEHWRSLFNSTKAGDEITVPKRFQDIIDEARRIYTGVSGQQHLPNVDLSQLQVTNAHPSSQISTPDPPNVRYVDAPDGYHAMSRFPLDLTYYLAAMMGVPVHSVMEHSAKPVSEWPTDLYLKFVKYGTHYDGLLFEACIKTRTYLDTSTIPNTGKGLFSTEGFVENELIAYFYGHLVYDPHTYANDNLSLLRFGNRGLYTTVDDMFTNGFKLDDVKNPDFYSNDDREKYDIFLVPFKSCPALYVQDHRILGSDGIMTDQEHFSANATFKVNINQTKENLKEPLTIGIFAIKDIEPNEEIFVNYGPRYTTNVGDGSALLQTMAQDKLNARRRSNRTGRNQQGSKRNGSGIQLTLPISQSGAGRQAKSVSNPSFWQGESLLEKWTPGRNNSSKAGASSSSKTSKSSRISTRSRK